MSNKKIRENLTSISATSGTDMIRMFHKNSVQNLRNMHEPSIKLPPIVSRAKMVVNEDQHVVLFTADKDV